MVNEFTEKQQQVSAALKQLELDAERFLTGLKLAGAVVVTNTVTTAIVEKKDVPEPEDWHGLYEKLFVVANVVGPAMGLSAFIVAGPLQALMLNWLKKRARQRYGVTDQMITEADGKLDGFKSIELKPFAKTLGRFLLFGFITFVIYTWLINGALLLDSTGIAAAFIALAAVLSAAGLGGILQLSGVAVDWFNMVQMGSAFLAIGELVLFMGDILGAYAGNIPDLAMEAYLPAVGAFSLPTLSALLQKLVAGGWNKLNPEAASDKIGSFALIKDLFAGQTKEGEEDTLMTDFGGSYGAVVNTGNSIQQPDLEDSVKNTGCLDCFNLKSAVNRAFLV